MDMNKARAILEAATGLKRHEWYRIVNEVNKRFDAASNRIALTREDAEGAEYLLRVEEGE